jgi:hypothetical protein|nr:MAG TPA: hypothetical protein [Caudoviricetes sp.]
MKLKLKRWPSAVADCTAEDKLKLNQFTCYGSYRYGGTCNCISHPVKEWIDFTNEIKEILE